LHPPFRQVEQLGDHADGLACRGHKGLPEP
jgi:hypothetical protein